MPPERAAEAFEALLSRARAATAESPLPILFSACILGEPTGFNGSAWPVAHVQALAALPTVAPRSFCPEAHVLSTPRPWMTIHGGDGHAVLAGTARVIDVEGTDLTDAFLRAAEAAHERAPTVAVLMDTSPSCGRNVVYKGEDQPERAYRAGLGVVAARLLEAGVVVLAHRDLRSLGRLSEALGGPAIAGHDFVEDPWFRGYFSVL